MDYSKTHFYKIVCKDLNIKDCYVGHTLNFKNRKSAHKNLCYNNNNVDYEKKLYQFIRANGGWDNFDMILIDTLKMENNLEARRQERMYIEELNATLNNRLPYNELNDWLNENKERLKKYKAEYVVKNKDVIYEKRKVYRQNMPDEVKQNEKMTRKKHYYANKEKNAEYAKEHYKQNIEKLKSKIECECGSVYSFFNKSRHLKTKKHQDYLASLI